jgi:hypothetical protein
MKTGTIAFVFGSVSHDRTVKGNAFLYVCLCAVMIGCGVLCGCQNLFQSPMDAMLAPLTRMRSMGESLKEIGDVVEGFKKDNGRWPTNVMETGRAEFCFTNIYDERFAASQCVVTTNDELVVLFNGLRGGTNKELVMEFKGSRDGTNRIVLRDPNR